MNKTKPCAQVYLVPIERVLPHERVEPRRVECLKADLLSDGVLKDPPIAARHNGRFIILDGATRTQALKELGALQIPIQVVRYQEPAVRLDSWNHVLLEVPVSEVYDRVQASARSQGYPVDTRSLRDSLTTGCCAFGLLSSDGIGIGFDGIENHHDHVDQLNRVVEACQALTAIHRVSVFDVSVLKVRYPSLSAVLAFARFRPTDVIQCVLDELQMPAGITRHLIDGRVLGLNLPLNLLMDSDSLKEKNRSIKQQIDCGSFKKTRTEDGETLLRFDATSSSK